MLEVFKDSTPYY